MNKEKLMSISEPLLQWYQNNKRELPWRSNVSSYKTWISEIMLQQTRVEAVIPYFERFIKRIPNVTELSKIPEEELLKLWEGLGYYSRARNLQKSAKILIESGQENLPITYQELLGLPGVGSYTAGAIASIAHQETVPAVDGNVFRVVTRVLEDNSNISKPSTRNKLEHTLTEIMPIDRPGDFNQALMELGATICIPNGMPLCNICPLNHLCQSYKNGTMLKFPVKDKKKERKVEERTVLIFIADNKIGIQKRSSKGLLANLFEFPNVEGNLTEQEVYDYVREHDMKLDKIKSLKKYIHIFTHIEWHMSPYLILLEEKPSFLLQWTTLQELHETHSLPTAFSKIIKDIEDKIMQKV